MCIWSTLHTANGDFLSFGYLILRQTDLMLSVPSHLNFLFFSAVKTRLNENTYQKTVVLDMKLFKMMYST